jgi:hypothetical protein
MRNEVVVVVVVEEIRVGVVELHIEAVEESHAGVAELHTEVVHHTEVQRRTLVEAVVR